MKGRRWADNNCTCPFYKAEEPQQIFCTGLDIGIVYHVAFATPQQLRDYKKKFCKSKSDEYCPLSKALQEFLERSIS